MRTFVLALAAAAAVVLPPAASAEDTPATRRSLRGLPGVGLHVQPLGADAEALGISADRLERLLRARLDAAHIPVLDAHQQQRTPGRPGLSLHVTALRVENGEFLYSVHLDLKQWVALMGGVSATLETPLSAPATTWSPDYRMGISPSDDAQADILTATREMIDHFIGAYRRTNPLKRPIP